MNRTVVVLADDLFWKTKIDQATKSGQAPAVFIADPAGLVKVSDKTVVKAVGQIAGAIANTAAEQVTQQLASKTLVTVIK